MERIDDTEEEVDFLPRRPPDDRRYEDRGVKGAGLADSRRTEPDPLVLSLGLDATCVDGGAFGCRCTCDVLALLRRRFESGLLLSGNLGLLPPLAFELGLLALFEVSLIQFLMLSRCAMKGCFLRRWLGTNPLG